MDRNEVKIIEKIIIQFFDNFKKETIDNEEYFKSIENILKGVVQYYKSKNFDSTEILEYKKYILDFSFELFKQFWLKQAKDGGKGNKNFKFIEETEINDCRQLFFGWFSKMKIY